MPTTFTTSYSPSQRLDYLFPEPSHPEINAALVPGTYAKGTILGEVTATPGTYKAYASASVDGSQNPALILMYACVVDGSGNISLGTSTTGGEFGQSFGKAAPAYYGGTFRCQEIVGLDANAVTKLAGKLVEGTVTNGIFQF